MIIERDDYITEEEFDKYEKIIEKWNLYINEFIEMDFKLESYSRSYSSHLNKSDNGFLITRRDSYSFRSDENPLTITNEQCEFYKIQDKLNSMCGIGDYYSSSLKNQLRGFVVNYEEVKNAANMWRKYKDKVIKVNKYNRKTQLKDIYEVIKFVEDKYE